MPKFTTPYNTKRQKTINTDPSMTKQEFKDDCDPTIILKKFQQTGLLEHAKEYEPVFGEQTSMTYHEAKQKTAEAETMFQDLPSETRQHFNHNVGEYLDYVANPDNVEKMKTNKGNIPLSTEENKEETPAETAEISE